MSPDHLREAVTTLEKSLNFDAKKGESLKILRQLPRILTQLPHFDDRFQPFLAFCVEKAFNFKGWTLN